MFTTEKAKSGKLTLYFNDKSIHSRYDPVAEANTFVKKQSFKKSPYLFILIGPGLGYIKTSILNNFPKAKILSLHMDRKLYKLTIKTGINWFYGDKKELHSVLAEFIPDFQLLETKIIKWYPCTNIFPERINFIESIIHQFFLERKGSIFTTGSFGRLWLRNISLNIFIKRKYFFPGIIKSTIIITASGPSLSNALLLLKENRNKYILAALSSSLPALNFAGIVPDFIFHTDPGFWAKEHLKSIIYNNIPIIMPLTSSFYSKTNNPLILLNQGSYIENNLLNSHFPKVAPHGTVAGTAYLFFRKITNYPIIYIGLDLCYKDVQEHVIPHSFDILIYIKQNRLNGYLSMSYKKQQKTGRDYNSIKSNTAFKTYSGWFNNESRLKNCFRFNPSEEKTKGLNNINLDQLLLLLNESNDKYHLHKNNSLNDNTPIKTNFISLLKKIIINLDKFKSEINIMNQEYILSFFCSSSLLLEIFQYLAYSEIIELSHVYRTDPVKSKEILINIHSNSYSYISSMLDRYNL